MHTFTRILLISKYFTGMTTSTVLSDPTTLRTIFWAFFQV